MNDNRKQDLKEILGITDGTVIESVIQYAQSLNMAVTANTRNTPKTKSYSG